MSNEEEYKEKKILNKILNKKALILIFIGFLARIFMLFYYYYTHLIDPQRSWGDAGEYFTKNLTSSPLTVTFLIFFRFLSFGNIFLFIFWNFFMDLLTCILFYFVLKNFKSLSLISCSFWNGDKLAIFYSILKEINHWSLDMYA